MPSPSVATAAAEAAAAEEAAVRPVLQPSLLEDLDAARMLPALPRTLVYEYLGLGKYFLDTYIGGGTFGSVYEAVVIETGKRVAVKQCIIDQQYPGVHFHQIWREISILRMPNHENIITLFDCYMSPGSMNLVFELMDGDLRGYLRGYVQRFRKGLPDGRLRSMFLQILQGVGHMHAMGVMHRDLKPDNILTRGSTVKIADFGLARTLGPGGFPGVMPLAVGPFTVEVVTLWYRPPEILLGSRHYSTSVDMWSCGCILAEMALGRVLFPGDSEIDTLFKTFELCGTPTEETFPGVSDLPNYLANFPRWTRPRFEVLLAAAPQLTRAGLELTMDLLRCAPTVRSTAVVACRHEYFAEPYLDYFALA
jgi:serine/threonine protein kinase